MIPHSKPTNLTDANEAMQKVLHSGFVGTGPITQAFEQALAKYCQIPNVFASSSGSNALSLALQALGIQSGDEVITPSYVCSAVLNEILRLGAVAKIIDVSPITMNITSDSIQAAITAKTRAIILVHMLGNAAATNEIVTLGPAVVEDCAMAIGATCNGQSVGSTGRLAMFSFHIEFGNR